MKKVRGKGALVYLAHSHASRERIDSAAMPKPWGNALNALQGIIATGATFKLGWRRQSPALKAPTELKEEQMSDHTVRVFVRVCCRLTCIEWCFNAGLVCPLGHSCPTEGTVRPFPCMPGTFSNATRATSCKADDGNVMGSSIALEGTHLRMHAHAF